MELQHFSHRHPLISKDEVECNGEEEVCSGCEAPISAGPYYSCESCNFSLRKKCAELPLQVKRHFHPEHPLSLVAKPPYRVKRYCDLCNRTCKSFVYRCSRCNFDLDTKCAFPPCLFDGDSHEVHQFRCLLPSVPLKSFSFTCNACGNEGDGSPFVCTTCLLMVHKKCISLPNTIKTRMHHHPQLMHTFSLGESDESEKHYCGICLDEVKSGFGGYCCPQCEFVAHVVCAMDNKALNSEGKENEDQLGTTADDELIEPAFHIVKEIKEEKEIKIVEIKHFSHQHNLILMDDVNHDLKCDGCMLPISSPYYGCAECSFFLDKSCIELPRQKNLHYTHPMTLISKAGTCDGVFLCVLCKQHCHGFNYRCEECEESMDVRCFNLLKDYIEHEGHEHRLFLAIRDEDRCCNACGETKNSGLFRCTDCGFNLDFACASLPHKIWHPYDNHPLFLTFNDPNTYQFYCLICEKERDRKLWFYRCHECDFDAHPECSLGKYPYIKFGGTYMYSFHGHPLALVESIEREPACHTCGKPCIDLTLECTDSLCNFTIHRERSCMGLSDSDSEVE